jgi:hypothetical protein
MTEKQDVQATRRRAQRVLYMVGELHKLGYQKLRISPGMAPSGMHWRCTLTPVDNVLRSHGALVARDDNDLVARYSSAMENSYFDWTDARTASARELAGLFLERFPLIAARSAGEDWVYAGWYVQMLGVAETGHFPMAFNDWSDLSKATVLPTIPFGVAEGSPELPLPPPGTASGLPTVR